MIAGKSCCFFADFVEKAQEGRASTRIRIAGYFSDKGESLRDTLHVCGAFAMVLEGAFLCYPSSTVVLSLAVIGAVAVAVFVVQQVMVGEAVKGVELLTSAGTVVFILGWLCGEIAWVSALQVTPPSPPPFFLYISYQVTLE